ncbi:MAG: hypothetical protein KF718_01480 [Polyangiaceae bacterium]|nr:hypothetical protein [Polyangiaceae bacterium]
MAQIYEVAAERRPKSLLLEGMLVTPSLSGDVGEKTDASASAAVGAEE